MESDELLTAAALGGASVRVRARSPPADALRLPSVARGTVGLKVSILLLKLFKLADKVNHLDLEQKEITGGGATH